jgi:hypothetical protein
MDSWFRIDSGLRQRSEGEKVRFDDDVFLLSINSERYVAGRHRAIIACVADAIDAPMCSYIHVRASDKCPGGDFERTPWRLLPFSSSQAEESQHFLKGGDVIRIAQRHTSSFVVAPTHMARDDAGSDFPVRLCEQGSSASAIMNPGTYWRVELDCLHWAGCFVQFNQPMRLLSVSMNQYLAFDESNNRLVLESDRRAAAKFFLLPADAKVSVLVSVSRPSFCCCQCVCVPMWLCVFMRSLDPSVVEGELSHCSIWVGYGRWSDQIGEFFRGRGSVQLPRAQMAPCCLD